MADTETYRKVTISTIAEHLNISSGTVSYVLSGQARKRKVAPGTEQRVKAVAQKLGYVPNHWARSLQGSKTGTISLLFHSLESDWAHRIIRGVISVLEDKSYVPVVMPYGWRTALQRDWGGLEHREIYAILERRDEGVICQPSANALQDFVALSKSRIPMVFIGSILEDMTGLENVSSVTWDCVQATTTIVNHLIRSGRKRIGFMGARHGLVADTQRFNAYKSAVEQAGLEIDGKWVFRGNVFMAPSFETIEAAFLDPHRPDAFFVLNDSIAIHLVKVLEKIGVRVPDDVAVVGMGDLPISEAYGLTTMSEPLEELGKESAKLLTQLIENPNTAPSHRRIECNNLIVRRTAP